VFADTQLGTVGEDSSFHHRRLPPFGMQAKVAGTIQHRRPALMPGSPMDGAPAL